MKKIDFHVHLTPPDISRDLRRYAGREPYFALLSQSPRNRFADADGVVSMLGDSGFDAAVVFGFGFKDPGLCRLANDYVIESSRLHPQKLVGFMSVSPGARGAEREIARCHDAGLRGVGEIFPEGQDFEIDDAGKTRAFAGACAERGLPVIVHVNEPVGHDYPGKTGTSLRRIAHFVENHGELRIVLAHLGGGLPFYEAMPELRAAFRNVFYDTAAVPLLYDESVYQAALALGLGGKIVFGSDFPLLSPSRYMPQMAKLEAAQRGRILGGNAELLLSGQA